MENKNIECLLLLKDMEKLINGGDIDVSNIEESSFSLKIEYRLTKQHFDRHEKVCDFIDHVVGNLKKIGFVSPLED